MSANMRCDELLKSYGIQLNNVPIRPRPPPRFIRPPSPLNIERPQPIVSDVSLLLDSASTSFISNPELDRDRDRSTSHLSELDQTGISTRNSTSNSNNTDRTLSSSRNVTNNSNASTEEVDISPGIKFANFIPTPPSFLGGGGATNFSTNNDRDRRKDDSGRDTLTSTSPPTRRGGNGNGGGDMTMMTDASISRNVHEQSNNSAANYLGQSSRSNNNNESLSTIEVDSLRSDLSRVVQTVTKQNDAIVNLESQLNQIIAFQEKFLVHFLRKGSGVAKSTQTDDLLPVQTGKEGEHLKKAKPSNSPSNNDGSKSKTRTSNSKAHTSRQQQPRRSGSNSNGNANSASPTATATGPTTNTTNRRSPLNENSNSSKSPVTKGSASKEGRDSHGGGVDKNSEDVSTMLRNLHISNVQGPSLYSEASFKSLDLPQLNDEGFHNDNSGIGSPYIGPSASAYGSSSDDEEAESSETVVPTATFYNNLLSTVNRILDGGGKPVPQPQGNVQNNDIFTTPKGNQNQQTNNRNFIPDKPSDIGSFVSYTSGSSSASSAAGGKNITEQRKSCDCGENKENQGGCKVPAIHSSNTQTKPLQTNEQYPTNDNVADVTKKYLQSLGVQFDSPVPPSTSQPSSNSKAQQQNYMIQQNVYNSIYIPTVNCVPVVTDSMNSNSGMMENLAHKYIPQSELNQYEALQNKKLDGEGITETTVYGMTSSNLSFATKQYLQRYGLVGQSMPSENETAQLPPLNLFSTPGQIAQPHGTGFSASSAPPAMTNDRILDITAIRNQPKLL